ncbi:hypothetical protein V6U89_16770 [Micromonospora sp. CPCC 206171]|uniref:hypothetical protein n=1 Tax=Micromonospora sp. CPCC 206171 TaxID=3122405 RepID=UPI002FEF587B
MTTIPLGDYVGYCFTEAVRAREIADEYSRHIAEQKSVHPVLRDFSTPRFRVAKLELTIPMVVDDVKFQRVARFVMDRDEFVKILLARAWQARAMAEQELRPPLEPYPDDPRPEPVVDSRAGHAATALYDDLSGNPDPMHPDDIVRIGWTEVFDLTFMESPLLREHRESDVIARLRAQTTRRIVDLVRGRTVLDRLEIEQLPINPLTQVIHDVGDTSSLLSVKAELVEEGFYLRQARDSETGTTHTIVDFE